MKQYEVMLIVDPDLDDGATEQLIKSASELIQKNGGAIEKTDVWGRKRLAFPIDKKSSGHYSVTYFTGEPATIKELDRVLKITDGVLRHLVVHRVITRQGTRAMAQQVAAPAAAE